MQSCPEEEAPCKVGGLKFGTGRVTELTSSFASSLQAHVQVPALLESLGHESRALPKAPQACANALAPRNLRDTFGQLRGSVSKKNKKLGLRDRGWPPKGQARVALACMLLSGDLFTGQMRAWTFKLDSLGTHPLIYIEGYIFC